jgi:hypothetical protein
LSQIKELTGRDFIVDPISAIPREVIDEISPYAQYYRCNNYAYQPTHGPKLSVVCDLQREERRYKLRLHNI